MQSSCCSTYPPISHFILSNKLQPYESQANWDTKNSTWVNKPNNLTTATNCMLNDVSERVFREIIWVLKLLEDGSANGYIRSSWRCYYPLSLAITICQVVVPPLLHYASLSLPVLVKSLQWHLGLGWRGWLIGLDTRALLPPLLPTAQHHAAGESMEEWQ